MGDMLMDFLPGDFPRFSTTHAIGVERVKKNFGDLCKASALILL